MLSPPFLVALGTAAAVCGCGVSQDERDLEKRHPRVDAATPGTVADASTPPDASPPSGNPGVVSCYSEGLPSASCTTPSHCCFSNYSSAHNGYCTTATCAYGTIDCDGPEDCGTGQRCCAHAIIDPDQGLTGYRLACQTTACGTAPANEELCHSSSTCSGGGSCVSAFGNQNDLPRTMSICK